MATEVVSRYGLFQTLDVNIPSREMNEDESVELYSELAKGSVNPSDAEAIFMLICEYARVYDDYSISFDEGDKLPFSECNVNNEHPVYTLEELPTHLKWVLYNFLVKNK